MPKKEKYLKKKFLRQDKHFVRKQNNFKFQFTEFAANYNNLIFYTLLLLP